MNGTAQMPPAVSTADVPLVVQHPPKLDGFQVSQDWDFVLVDFQHLNNYSGAPAGSRVHACMYWGAAQKLLGCTVEVSCLLAPAIATC